MPRHPVVLFGIAALAGAVTLMADEPSADPRPHLAVAGFVADESVPPREQWLPVAVEEMLAWRLRRIPGLLVVPTLHVVQARRELTEDPAAPPPWGRAVAAVGADWMITGTCSGHTDGLACRLSVLNATDGTVRAETTLAAERLFTTLDRATDWLAAQFPAAPLAPEMRELVYMLPRSPSALEYYARALQAARAEQFKDAYYYTTQGLTYDEQFRPGLGMLIQLEIQVGAAGRAAAGKHLRALAELARLHNDLTDQAAAELGLGTLLHASGAFEVAYERYETALGLAYSEGAPYGELAALSSLGDLYLSRRVPAHLNLPEAQVQRLAQQDLDWAAAWQEIALGILERLGDSVAQAPAASKLALTYEHMGDTEAALRAYQRSLAAAERIGSARHQAAAWLYIGQSHQRAGRLPEALDATARSLELAPREALPAVRLALAGMYQAAGQSAVALEQLDSAYAQLRQGDDLAQQLTCIKEIAALRRQLGQHDAARVALQEALDIAHALKSGEEQALQEQLAEWKRNP